jgi:ubiquinone/menaquinone biosynthesis C-methylase UbiE
MNDIKKYWDNIASQYNVDWHISHAQSSEQFWESGFKDIDKIFNKNLDQIPHGSFVLDVGCGKGRLVQALASKRSDLNIFGLDVSASMIKLAYDYNKSRNCRFVVGNGFNLSVFPESLFDVVYSYIVIQHVPRYIAEQIVDDCYRVLKPGGRLFFQLQSNEEVQEVDPPWDDFRKIRYYTPLQAKKLVGKNLIIESIRGGGHDLFCVACKPS